MATVEQCKQEIGALKAQIEEIRKAQAEASPLGDYAKANNVPKVGSNLKARKTLKGHFGKIYALHWSGADSKQLVSASQDGKLIVWNAYTTNKLHAIPLRSSWVMTCAFSPSGNFVACGGLDNLCSVYKVPNAKQETSTQQIKPIELAQHEGYLSCCRFISDEELVSSSGDSTCILWDVTNHSPKATFTDHTGDVMSLSVYDKNGIFVSGSCDSSAKLWDHRSGKTNCVKSFSGHESDINSVQFFPDGHAFGTGSDDSSCRIFDIRSFCQLNKFANERILCGITSVGFSKTGKLFFAGYDDLNCYVWDVQHGNMVTPLSGHENRVSCIGVSEDGKALCSGSWDTMLKIWA